MRGIHTKIGCSGNFGRMRYIIKITVSFTNKRQNLYNIQLINYLIGIVSYNIKLFCISLKDYKQNQLCIVYCRATYSLQDPYNRYSFYLRKFFQHI